jgi:magnesium chelatase family protein
VGGGQVPLPGEISLAHEGVLFLDELPEFDRRVLESLREPLETGEVTIARARLRVTYPARFQLVAAMNPCPCGYSGTPGNRCNCSAERMLRYQERLSGPLLDRIDLHVQVPPLPRGILTGECGRQESLSQAISAVALARRRMLERQGCSNSRLSGRALDRHCRPGAAGRRLLDDALESLGLSARGYHRVLRVARTLADLADRTDVSQDDLLEALAYRRLTAAREATR